MNSPQFFKMDSREEPASPSMLMACAPPIREPAILDLNRIEEYKGIIYIMLQSKGRKWMDFVSPWDSSAPVVCSLRVVQALAEAGLTGYRAYPVEFLSDPGKKLESPCPYYMIIPTGHVAAAAQNTISDPRGTISMSFWMNPPTDHGSGRQPTSRSPFIQSGSPGPRPGTGVTSIGGPQISLWGFMVLPFVAGGSWIWQRGISGQMSCSSPWTRLITMCQTI